jgi:hypothetical protein
MKLLRLFALLFVPALSFAQFTTVTGTVVDPNGIPYANGTIVPTLSTSASPTLNGGPYTPPSQPVGLDINGKFTLQLADNTVLLPASTKWNFTVCSGAGTVNPAIGTGSQCFSLAAPITISGSSQSISTQLNAVALALTLTPGGSKVSSVSGVSPIVATPNPITGTGSISCPTCSVTLNLQTQYNMSCSAVNGSSANTTTNGTVAPGTSVLLTSATGFAPGQGIYIAGAGSAGGVYNGVVQTVVSSTVTVSPATSTSVTNAVVANYSWPSQTTTNGTVAPGTSVPVVSAATFLPNQGIYIAGAGAAAANYVGTISTVVGNTITVSPATSTSVTNATVQHDESASLNSAISDLAAGAINGTLRFPAGICLFNGPLLQTSGANAIVPMPIIPYNPNNNFTGANGPTLRVAIEGAAPPAFSNYNIVGWYGIPSTTGTVIQTSGTSGNLFGASNPNETDSFTAVQLYLRNVTLRAPDNPAITMVNGTNMVGLNVENMSCDTLALGAQSTPSQPTHTNGQCLVYSQGNDDAEELGRNLHIQGFYSALLDGEHLTLDHVSLYDNWQGYVCNLNATFHVGHINLLDLSDNAYGISATQACTIYVRQLDVEVSGAPSWVTGATNTAQIYDPNNFLYGLIEFDSQNSGNSRLLRYGGSNLQVNTTLGVTNGGNLTWRPGFVGPIAWLVGTTTVTANVNTHCDALGMSIIPPPSPTNGIANGCAATGFNFTGKTITIRVPHLIESSANGYTTFDVGNDITHMLEIYVGQTTIGFQKRNGGSFVSVGTATYTPTSALWWRMTESSGAVTASYSADGVNFVTIGTCAATCTTWAYTSTNVDVSVQYLGNGPAFPGYSQFDSFNVNGAAPAIPSANIFEAGLSTNPTKIYTNTQALTGGAATHTLANSFTFTSSSTFGCTCTDQTAANACQAVPASATTITLAGTGTDVLWLSCSGH